MGYSFNDFWSTHLAGVVKGQHLSELPGWYGNLSPMQSFVPANVLPRSEFSDLSKRIWLIAAPGAVGKSTLAKEICALTGAVYLDLAEASTVAGNYLIGGLVYTNLLDAWSAGTTTIVIDALDEARLRVTQSGFEDFLADVAKVARKGRAPIVLLGRVGIIEEAWLIINENSGIAAPIFDIEFFDAQQAKHFVMARLSVLSTEKTNGILEYPHLAASLSSHAQVYDEAVTEVISGISQLSQADADRFVGYAPVLDAVAKVIAAEQNPARINEDMRRVLEGEVLTSLASEILNREAGKLITQLKSTHADFPEDLYTSAEQLHRLACQIFSLPAPPMPGALAQEHVAAYEHAVKNLLPQHPFLNGNGKGASSSIFEAAIISSALKNASQEIRASAEKHISSAKHTANPFLFDFYLSLDHGGDEVPAEHLGFLFDSVVSKATTGDKVRLYVGENLDDTIESEIIVERNGGKPNTYKLSSPKGGLITLGRKVSGVLIACEHTNVQLGLGGQLELVSPTSVQCRQLRLVCDQVVVKTDPRTTEDMILLEAEELVAGNSVSAPIVRPAAVFRVSWPNSEAYPWTPFNITAVHEEAPHVSEGLRTLRRLVMAFRSHSKGQLARFCDKIEHSRMLKGKVGEALLQKLINDGVVWAEGPMYCLDANKLGAQAGISFQDAQAKRYSKQTREYVSDLNV
ncbi:hypothetical protein E0E50_00705 [Azotobacter chroococcum subsp. isscasi]|uniref:hypothetical protein n=1 Tax=Azotobacter chroococcum TaxID=353 RepID=UPI0010403EFD|nr:hypothetical protein [Azotobacter chroococcum]TBW13030.1 hypothetical protein E0E50_00705 [Azotobacter chroococcum subsp. isscasi]